MTDQQKAAKEKGIQITLKIVNGVFALATAVLRVFKSENKLASIWSILTGKAFEIFEGVSAIFQMASESDEQQPQEESEFKQEIKDLDSEEYAELVNLIASHVWNIKQIASGAKK